MNCRSFIKKALLSVMGLVALLKTGKPQYKANRFTIDVNVRSTFETPKTLIHIREEEEGWRWLDNARCGWKQDSNES